MISPFFTIATHDRLFRRGVGPISDSPTGQHHETNTENYNEMSFNEITKLISYDKNTVGE